MGSDFNDYLAVFAITDTFLKAKSLPDNDEDLLIKNPDINRPDDTKSTKWWGIGIGAVNTLAARSTGDDHNLLKDFQNFASGAYLGAYMRVGYINKKYHRPANLSMGNLDLSIDILSDAKNGRIKISADSALRNTPISSSTKTILNKFGAKIDIDSKVDKIDAVSVDFNIGAMNLTKNVFSVIDSYGMNWKNALTNVAHDAELETMRISASGRDENNKKIFSTDTKVDFKKRSGDVFLQYGAKRFITGSKDFDFAEFNIEFDATVNVLQDSNDAEIKGEIDIKDGYINELDIQAKTIKEAGANSITVDMISNNFKEASSNKTNFDIQNLKVKDLNWKTGEFSAKLEYDKFTYSNLDSLTGDVISFDLLGGDYTLKEEAEYFSLTGATAELSFPEGSKEAIFTLINKELKDAGIILSESEASPSITDGNITFSDIEFIDIKFSKDDNNITGGLKWDDSNLLLQATTSIDIEMPDILPDTQLNNILNQSMAMNPNMMIDQSMMINQNVERDVNIINQDIEQFLSVGEKNEGRLDFIYRGGNKRTGSVDEKDYLISFQSDANIRTKEGGCNGSGFLCMENGKDSNQLADAFSLNYGTKYIANKQVSNSFGLTLDKPTFEINFDKMNIAQTNNQNLKTGLSYLGKVLTLGMIEDMKLSGKAKSFNLGLAREKDAPINLTDLYFEDLEGKLSFDVDAGGRLSDDFMYVGEFAGFINQDDKKFHDELFLMEDAFGVKFAMKNWGKITKGDNVKTDWVPSGSETDFYYNLDWRETISLAKNGAINLIYTTKANTIGLGIKAWKKSKMLMPALKSAKNKIDLKKVNWAKILDKTKKGGKSVGDNIHKSFDKLANWNKGKNWNIMPKSAKDKFNLKNVNWAKILDKTNKGSKSFIDNFSKRFDKLGNWNKGKNWNIMSKSAKDKFNLKNVNWTKILDKTNKRAKSFTDNFNRSFANWKTRKSMNTTPKPTWNTYYDPNDIKFDYYRLP